MIEIVLLILKIIGITLMALLLTLLVVLALVLFVPICYRIRVVHNPDTTRISGRATYLPPLLVFKFRFFEKEFSYTGQVFWHIFLNSAEDKEEKPKKQKKEKKTKEKKRKQKPENSRNDITVADDRAGEVTGENFTQERDEAFRASAENLSDRDSTATETKTSKTGWFAKIRNKIQEIRDTISGILKTIGRLFRQKDEALQILAEEETKNAISFAWGKLKKTVKHILPRKVKGQLILGFDDPAVTGQVLGVISVLFAATGQLFRIVPDFERARLESDLEFRGRLKIFTLLVIALKVYLNKELKQVTGKMKKIKDIE